MGKSLGDLPPAERRAVIEQAAAQLQAELTTNAPAIARILEDPPEDLPLPRVATVRVIRNYVDRVYPADDTAILLARLTGQKTFSADHIRTIRALGYAVHVAAGQLPAGW